MKGESLMDEGWLSVTEIAEKTNIPKSTIRRYLIHHNHCLQVEKRKRGYFMAEKSIPIIYKIRDLYIAGKQAEEIDQFLIQINNSSITSPVEESRNLTNNEVLSSMNQTITELKETIEKQKELLSDVVQMLGRTYKEKEDEIKQLNNQIDMLLAQIRVMKEAEEAREQIAAAKKSWINRWLPKK